MTLLSVRPYSLGETDPDAILLAHAYARDSGGLPRERIDDLTAPHPWRELGLTPTEMEIAKQLLDGRSVVEIADAHSISREGVRFHIKGLLGKTHCHRQSQLVAKLAKLMWQSTF